MQVTARPGFLAEAISDNREIASAQKTLLAMTAGEYRSTRGAVRAGGGESAMADVASPEVDDAEWDAWVASHPQGHILQTSRWARLKCAFGWSADRVVLRTSGDLNAPILAGASVLYRRLPWGQTLAYIPKGPLVDWADRAQTRALLNSIREACGKRHAAVLKVEPNLPYSETLVEALTANGFQLSPQRVQPLSTIHIDLSAEDEAILAGMKPKWRYNIRLSERKGVTVRQGTAADLPAIQRLMEITGKRDGFEVHSAEYYALATELFVPEELASWWIAEYAGGMLAAIAVFASGQGAWYMWGASGENARNLMPNHALQWAAISWAKRRGCLTYDLWGIPDVVGEHPEAYADSESWGSDGLWGVYRFKQGFGGHVVRYAGAWDMPVSAAGYALYRTALRFRRSD
jgi:peptidoglycan pentaglycine glycine transferase (the first glycine)